jgi:hypothetical protein
MVLIAATPGSLFAMGWLMSLSKGFIRFFESAKKKNYLAKASILFYFIHQLSSIASKTITLHPPCAPRRSCVLSYPSPVPPGCFWLVVVRISIVWRPFQVASYFFLLLFVDQFDGRNDDMASSHTFRPGRISPPSLPPPLTPAIF